MSVMLVRRASDLLGHLLPELSKFGVVGLVGLVVDVGGFNLLRFGGGGVGPLHDYPLTAKLVAASLSTVASWLGHRYWTFRHSRRAEIHHEFLWFVFFCTIGTLIATGCLALTHYGFGMRSALEDNISANVVGLALGTAFRFWSYRTFVFSQRGPVQVDGPGSAGDAPSSVPSSDLADAQAHPQDEPDHFQSQAYGLSEVTGHG